jgi:pyrimidine operon attenuation protein/uracil phosphoribosyltransferase
MADPTVILTAEEIGRTLVRLAHEIVEKDRPGSVAGEGSSQTAADHSDDQRNHPLALIGVHRRGAVLAQRVKRIIDELTRADTPLGTLDISFYRDDLGRRGAGEPRPEKLAPVVRSTEIDFAIDGLTIVIIDDVLYTGRTARAAIDALFDYGRPARVQLATLIDRGHRELPIRPDFVGKNLPTALTQRVYVKVKEIDGVDAVTLEPTSPIAA